MTNVDRIEGRWTQIRGALRKRYGKLTDDELEQARGSAERLRGLLQERYGLAKQEAAKKLDEVLTEVEERVAEATGVAG
ncbi:MAG: CsbD family protein [Thermoanaerobaculia bacterium]|nr:CsbD family protein [Thermoanaerobaculia bacterium]